MGSPFTILQFADDRIDDSLYLEDAMKRTNTSEDPDLLRRHLDMFKQIQEKAEHTGPFEKHATRIIEAYFT